VAEGGEVSILEGMHLQEAVTNIVAEMWRRVADHQEQWFYNNISKLVGSDAGQFKILVQFCKDSPSSKVARNALIAFLKRHNIVMELRCGPLGEKSGDLIGWHLPEYRIYQNEKLVASSREKTK
jgi:hypothetical protein